MARLPKAPAVDQRSADLAKVGAELTRLEKLLTEKREALAANTRLHALDQDATLQARLKSEIGAVEELIGKQRDMRFTIELGDSKPLAPTAQPARPKKAWEIKNLPRPTYPTGARQRGDQKALATAFASFVEYHIDQANIAMQKANVDAAAKVSIELLMDVAGEHLGVQHWMTARIAELEDRINEIEATGIKYVGTYQRASSYKRGSVVSHSGSSWVAIKDVGEGVAPIEGHDTWQLMVKKGRDGKDASQ
ncbi:hypothetical protein [Mesorhizobium sp.]|uniref:hypothetical protein n=1 Tax=Mesorhizobium sp. TaxID=1871066 RepID=UPI001211CD54|nr:hypothetical protein [Mesorhizobium sp.]TIQ05727.1 MAG: hypothetical protein E5X50_19745 [Mesorhizobium sp.]